MKLRIHAGSTLPSSVCTLMHEFDDTMDSKYCCRVLLCVLVTVLLSGFQCFSDSEIDDASVVDGFFLCFNVVVGSSMKIG